MYPLRFAGRVRSPIAAYCGAGKGHLRQHFTLLLNQCLQRTANSFFVLFSEAVGQLDDTLFDEFEVVASVVRPRAQFERFPEPYCTFFELRECLLWRCLDEVVGFLCGCPTQTISCPVAQLAVGLGPGAGLLELRSSILPGLVRGRGKSGVEDLARCLVIGARMLRGCSDKHRGGSHGH